MVSEKLPYKTVRRILKRHWDGEISQESCIYVRDFISTLLNDLVENCVDEFREYNGKREKQGLPKLKRIDLATFKRVSTRLLKSALDINVGEVGQCNRDTTLPQKAIEVV